MIIKHILTYTIFDLQVEAALMYDALHVLSNALQQLDKSTRLRLVNLTCEGDQAWAFGSSLYNYLNLVSICAGVMLPPILWCSVSLSYS